MHESRHCIGHSWLQLVIRKSTSVVSVNKTVVSAAISSIGEGFADAYDRPPGRRLQ
jgi:hypothetical protein